MSIDPIRHEVTVPIAHDRAFELFTEQMGAWWPSEHRIGNSPKVDIEVDRRVGGAVTEIGEDGSRCRLGEVLVWEPPSRLVVSWQITSRWTPEPDPTRASEYEVTFEPQPGGATRVAVEHRGIDRHGSGGLDIAGAVDGPQGWPHVLASLCRFATSD